MLKLLVALCILILPVLHLNISVEAASPHNIETVFDYALDIDFYEDAEFPGVRFPNLAGLTGAQVKILRRTPPWPYNPNSQLLKIAAECYKPVFDRDAELKAIHGGLECGVFLEKIPGLDIIAIGPKIIDLHTPQERLSIASTAKMWEFMQLLLKSL